MGLFQQLTLVGRGMVSIEYLDDLLVFAMHSVLPMLFLDAGLIRGEIVAYAGIPEHNLIYLYIINCPPEGSGVSISWAAAPHSSLSPVGKCSVSSRSRWGLSWSGMSSRCSSSRCCLSLAGPI